MRNLGAAGVFPKYGFSRCRVYFCTNSIFCCKYVMLCKHGYEMGTVGLLSGFGPSHFIGAGVLQMENKHAAITRGD